MQQFGWSQDEWDDGEKVDDDIDLQEERAVLSDAAGYKIVTITKDQKKTKEQEHVFAKYVEILFVYLSDLTLYLGSRRAFSKPCQRRKQTTRVTRHNGRFVLISFFSSVCSGRDCELCMQAEV